LIEKSDGFCNKLPGRLCFGEQEKKKTEKKNYLYVSIHSIVVPVFELYLHRSKLSALP
jgi:hypothetical protein